MRCFVAIRKGSFMPSEPNAARDRDKSAADIYGPWVEPDWQSGLVDRLRQFWSVPIKELPDTGLALFLRQCTAVKPVLIEARRRLEVGQPDDSEMYDGELARAVEDTKEPT
jgi:hypothetical protein